MVMDICVSFNYSQSSRKQQRRRLKIVVVYEAGHLQENTLVVDQKTLVS